MSEQPKWEGRSKGTTLGYKIFVWLLKAGGLRPAYALLHFVTLYYRLFVPSATKPLHFLYQQLLGYDRRTSKKLVKKNLLIFGQTILDKLAVLAGIGEQLSFAHEGVENIEQLVKEGKGGILVSAHLGNWEVAGHMLKRVNSVINIVMYDGEADQIKQYMDQFESNPFFQYHFYKG